MTARKTTDWRGVPIRMREPEVAAQHDAVTGERVCVWCGTPLGERTARARFCGHNCRSYWWHSRMKTRAAA